MRGLSQVANTQGVMYVQASMIAARDTHPRQRNVRRALVVALLLVAGLLPAQQEGLVEVYAVASDNGSYSFYANNNHIIPVYIQVDAPTLVNMRADRELPVSMELDAGEQDRLVFSISPTRATGRRGYSLSYSYAQGNPETARHDENHLYLLPFTHATKHRLSQGYGGRFSHYGENEYAVDFEMPEGTEVYAARGGIVAEVKEDSSVGGPGASYGDDANYILILHSDGSFGNYAHLVRNGAVVEPGERVAAGQLIGYSGNTGRSSGPHLHFDVRLPTFDGTMQSVPFLFAGHDGAEEPEEGRFYYAYHPGGRPFDPVFGSDITMADYASYRAPVEGQERIETRVDQVDLTFLLFVQNGLSTAQNVEIRLELSGLSSEAGNPVSITVPARTEVLATILQPVAGATAIRYGYSLRAGF
jgi:murein DD-endopeptidase MepM/ murein hydrolase activator NlpD